VDERLSCVATQLKSQPLERMLQKDFQLNASQIYLGRFCLKIKVCWDVAYHWTAFLAITRSWSKPILTHTHTKEKTEFTETVNIHCKVKEHNEKSIKKVSENLIAKTKWNTG
jgi:hypothetical protein